MLPRTQMEDINGAETPTGLEMVRHYHERTKHRLNRYAASPGYLDWANQPDPFRRFKGAPVTPLPFATDRCTATYDALYVPGAMPPAPMDLASVSALLELSLGLSAWKRAGASTWALRCNPSSGNLHPTEGYLLCRDVEGLPSGIHHYAPHEHALELRNVCTPDLPDGCLVVGLSSIPWREAWKYGERAFRYCQHDAGHAVAALRYAAAAIGWTARLLAEPSDEDISHLLGLERAADFVKAEREHPDALVVIGPASGLPIDVPRLLSSVEGGAWQGRANRLSDETVRWDVIDAVAEAAVKPRTLETQPAGIGAPVANIQQDSPRAVDIIRKRRSAQGFDGRSSLAGDSFFAMVNRLVAPASSMPWDALPWGPLVHPVFLAHRVEGLTPGLYALPRSESAGDKLRAAMDPSFLWTPVSAGALPLYLLREGDAREAAQIISCHQDIASDGMFTLGMLAEFDAVLEDRGAWWYRRLFWEAGLLGQMLYLEAEAAGVRGTGIGCYFDDLFHGLLGVEDTAFQSLYHFTVGMPVDDPRLQTLPAYAHLHERRDLTP